MNKVTITGAGGFIGSHLAETLVREGAKVKVFVHYNSRNDPGLMRLIDRSVLDSIEAITGDLCDPEAVRHAIKGSDTVFHLGALIGIPYSYRNPVHVAQVNVMGTMNVLMAARDYGTERIVHTSTSEVYGTARQVPISESHPLQAQSPYSASKIGADKLAESFYCAYSLPVVTVRPFNTYGPRQSARAVIPTIITQALRGPEVHLGNLEARRDFTYVSDTVNGFLYAARATGVEGRVINLGVGQDFTIGEIANAILRIVDAEGNTHGGHRIVEDGSRLRPEKSEVMRLISDNRLAKELLGWQPEVNIEEGLRQTVAWIRGHLELYQNRGYEV